MIAHRRREILHVNVTAHPTASWVTQQLRETFPGDTPIRFMIHDNDSIFSNRVDEVIARFGIEPKMTACRSPWQNGLAERWVGTVKRDLLDHVIVIDERHLQRLLHEYVDYYNNERVHTVLRDSPTGRPRRVRLNPTPESLGDRDWEDFTVDTRGAKNPTFLMVRNPTFLHCVYIRTADTRH